MEPSFEQGQRISDILAHIQKTLEDPRIKGIDPEKRKLFIEQTCDIFLKKNPDLIDFKKYIIESFTPKKEDPIEKNRALITGFLERIEQRIQGKNLKEIDVYIRETIITSPTFLKAPPEIQQSLTQEFIHRGWLIEPSTESSIEHPKDTLSEVRELLEELKAYQFTIDRTKDFGIIGLTEQIFPDLSTKSLGEKNLIIQTVTDHYEQLLRSAEFATQDDRIKALLTQQFQEWKTSLTSSTPRDSGKEKKDTSTKKEAGWSLDTDGNIIFSHSEADGTIRKKNRAIFLGGPTINTPEKAADFLEFLNKIEKKFPSLDRMTCDLDSRSAKITCSTPQGAIESVSTSILHSKEEVELLRRIYANEPLNADEKRNAQRIQYTLHTQLKDKAMNRMVQEYLKEKKEPVVEPIDELPAIDELRTADEDESPTLHEPDAAERLAELRTAFIKAEGAWKKFEGPLGFLLGKLQGEKRTEIQKQLDEARTTYEQARAEYVLASLDVHLAEEDATLNERIEEAIRLKEKLIGKKLQEFFEKHKRAHFLISMGLLGIGFAIPALALPALGARRVLGGTFAGLGTLNLIQAWRAGRDKKIIEKRAKEFEEHEEKFWELDEEQVLSEILSLRSFAINYGQRLEGNAFYERLMKRWHAIVAFERGPFSQEELEGRNREAESHLEELRKKNKTADDIALFTGIGVGALAGSGVLAKAIGSLFLGHHSSGAASLKEAIAGRGSAHAAVSASIPVSSTVTTATEGIHTQSSIKSFEASHVLLKEHGLQPILHEGHMTLEAHLGKDGVPEYLDKLLRRMVSEEMNKKTFDALDKGRIENALANFRELLKGHSVLGISPDTVKMFAEFDGKTLKITDYDAYQKFMHDKLLAHANDVITPESGAVKEATKTSHAAWEHILELKNKEIHVEDFSTHTESVAPHEAPQNVIASHAENVRVHTENVHNPITPQATETPAPSPSPTVTPGSETATVGEISFQETGASPETGSVSVVDLSTSESFNESLKELRNGNLSLEDFTEKISESPEKFSALFLQRAKEYGVSYTAVIEGKEVALDNAVITRMITDPNYGSRNIQNLIRLFQENNRGRIDMPLMLNGREETFTFEK